MSESLILPPGHTPGETWKARARRINTGWFEKFAPPNHSGIDIGCQHDPLCPDFRKWDVIFGDGDATFMEGVADETYHTVYASHVLEHLENPIVAIQNWYRITEVGGHLIILVPHRDLYEKKSQPPSHWNHEHKLFWLPDEDDLPRCLSLKRVINEAIPSAEIVSFDILQEGWIDVGPLQHSSGEYSIEAIIKKR